MMRGHPDWRGEEGQRGVTLVELLAALVISAFIVVMAARIFLSGHLQFLDRMSESDRLETRYRLKGMLQRALKADVARCEGGKLWLREGAAEKDLGDRIRARFPDYSGSVFQCLELAPDGASLLAWKGRFQPRLVEYQVILKPKGKADTLIGSWIE